MRLWTAVARALAWALGEGREVGGSAAFSTASTTDVIQPTSAASEQLRGFSDDELFSAALEFVYGIDSTSDSFWGGTIEQCNATDQRIREARAKYADFEPSRMRKHIVRWLDYFQRNADKNRRDIETQKHRREHDAWRAKSERKDARVREIRAVLDVKGGKT